VLYQLSYLARARKASEGWAQSREASRFS